jgi:hypothetical protein
MATKTVRELAVEALISQLNEMTIGEPEADPYTVAWGLISRADLSTFDKGKKYILGVYDTEEEKSEKLYPTVDCSLRVILEFYYRTAVSEVPSEQLNRILGEVERKLREDRTLKGTIYDIVFVGNELDIDSPYDDYVSAMMVIVLKYRHHVDDPRRSA